MIDADIAQSSNRSSMAGKDVEVLNPGFDEGQVVHQEYKEDGEAPQPFHGAQDLMSSMASLKERPQS